MLLVSVLSLSLPAEYTLADEQSVDTAEAIVEEDNDDEESIQIAPFIPTKEWQVVDDGQSIPPGLHVRINFETGVKEAKLLDPEYKGEADHVATVDNSGVPVAKATSSDDSKALKSTGDQRRAHHYGNSDRRGIINKKTKPFTQQELMEAVLKQDDKSEEGPVQGITYSAPVRESDGGYESDGEGDGGCEVMVGMRVMVRVMVGMRVMVGVRESDGGCEGDGGYESDGGCEGEWWWV